MRAEEGPQAGCRQPSVVTGFVHARSGRNAQRPPEHRGKGTRALVSQVAHHGGDGQSLKPIGVLAISAFQRARSSSLT